ncbi:MAG: efflux RND transporter permease subunit [Deltaproteobacteria bacterium]|nr:efflux RND transporter permease subunit [Deltaproteobacteria bacterium]
MVGLGIRRPVTVLVMVILTTMFGILSLEDLPIQLTPDVAVPTLNVATVWPGASPREVESEILEPQEEALKSLTGLVRMESEARLERGTVTLELEVGTSIEESLVRVTNLLSQVPEYPDGARQPVISAADSAGPPLAVITVTRQGGQDPGAYRTWIEQRVQPRLERIKGVAQVLLIGGRDREVEVIFDQAALAARGLTITQVAARIRAELQDRSAGDITVGKRRYLVRTPLSPDQPEGLEEVVLATTADGTAVKLGDVAKVDFGLRKRDAWVFSDDTPSMVLLLFREAGSNVLEVTKQIRAEVDLVQEELLNPLGLSIQVVSDQVGYIEAALDLVRQNLVVGGLLAVLVLVLFLGSFRASAVVSVAIPVCTLGTALGMNLLGRTVNVVSLAGMAFAVGMVVDNAIVVLENIDTWKKREPDTAKAALLATSEVWGAILASTLTTAVVFVPIIAWQDEVGEILRDIAVAISVAVILSLIVSVLVIPSFATVVLKKEQGAVLSLGPVTKWADAGRAMIADVVRWVCRSKLRSAVVVIIALVGSIGASWALLPPMEYLPTGNRAFVFGILVPPPGYSVDEMGEIGRGIQEQVALHLGKEVDGVPAVERSFYVGRPENAFMGAGVTDPTKTREFLGWYRNLVSKVPGVFPVATQASLFGRRLGGGRAIEVELSGSDLEGLIKAAGPTLGAIKGAIPNAQVRPIPSLDLGALEYNVKPRREQVARVGLTDSDLALAVDALVDGAYVGEYGRPGEPKVDVVLSGAANDGGDVERGVSDKAELASAAIGTPTGGVVTLSSLADIEEALGPTIVRRIERTRAITLQVSPPEDVALESAMNIIRNQVLVDLRGKGVIPPEVRVTLAGNAGDLEQAQARMGQVLLLATLISFLLMAALFEDFLAPVAVMITVPLAAAGGLGTLALVDKYLGPQPLDMLTAVGFIILIGVVVNNAILVVDGAVARLRDGVELAEAVAYAVESRVRPIFMSALTSLAGLSPLVFFPGSGSELYRGVGAVVLGGLGLSTVLTLVVVPAIFALVWRLKAVRA